MLLRARIKLPLIAYFVSRFTTLGFVIMQVLAFGLGNHPPSAHIDLLNNWCSISGFTARSCKTANAMIIILFSIAISSTSLLLFLRFKAIFNDNLWLVRVYLILWALYVAASAFPASKPFVTSMGARCVSANAPAIIGIIPGIGSLLYPAMIYGPIAYRLHANAHLELNEAGLRTHAELLVFGRHLSTFSKTLFLDGQMHLL